MEIDTLKSFIIGFALGSAISGYLGYNFGKRMAKAVEKPEFRVVFASVIIAVWAIAQLFSLAFGTKVDGWLNAIMGMVAGFFFGDGVVETFKNTPKKK